MLVEPDRFPPASDLLEAGIPAPDPNLTPNVQEVVFGAGYELFVTAQAAEAYILDAYVKAGIGVTDHRALDPDTTRVTQQGLFLEFRGGTPNALWTPWGRHEFRGVIDEVPDDQRREANRKILDFVNPVPSGVKRQPFRGRRMTLFGEEGPVYPVVRVGLLIIPTPILTGPLDNAERYRLIREWKEFKERFEGEPHKMI